MKNQIALKTVADQYVNRSKYKSIFGVPKLWPGKRWVHLIHNWRTGGSSLTALLSVNVHDSYLKVGHPFTRDGWPVDYGLNPFQVTSPKHLKTWISSQVRPAIMAGHTYYGMAPNLGVINFDLWVTMREPAARLNSGLLRFHRKAMRTTNPQGGYIGNTDGHNFDSSEEISSVAKSVMSHELNGMCRRIAGYSVLPNKYSPENGDDLESCKVLDIRPVDKDCFDKAMANLEASKWIYLTDQVLPSLLLLEETYGLKPLIHPCSSLIHNPQWNGAGITRLQESLLVKHRSLLESLNSWDVKLYAEATRIFWERWRVADIDPRRLEARRVLQRKPLLNPSQLTDERAREVIVARISSRSRNIENSSTARWIENDGMNAMFWLD